jgi:hypothetical protein
MDIPFIDYALLLHLAATSEVAPNRRTAGGGD